MGIEQTLSHLDPIEGETEGYITAGDVKSSFIQTYNDFNALVPDGLEVTKTYVDQQDSYKLDKVGGTMTGPLTLNDNPSSNLHAATKQYADTGDAAAKAYADSKDALKLDKTGDTMTGTLEFRTSGEVRFGSIQKWAFDDSIELTGDKDIWLTPWDDNHIYLNASGIGSITTHGSSVAMRSGWLADHYAIFTPDGHDMAGRVVSSVGNPVNAADAANKGYADRQVYGLAGSGATATSLTLNTWTRINFPTPTDMDGGVTWNATLKGFVIPEDGVYTLSARVNAPSNATASTVTLGFSTATYLPATQIVSCYCPAGANYWCNYAWQTKFTAGEVIGLCAMSNVARGTDYNAFQISRV